MDRDKKKKLKQEYIHLVSKMERILKRYTPIDPLDDDSYGDEYEELAPPLVSMLMRGCDRDELFQAIESYRINYWRPVPPNPELDWKIADAVLKAFLAKDQVRKPPKPTKALFRLDLRIDFEQIIEYVKEQVRECVGTPETTGPVAKPVFLVEFGYEYSQSGWVMIHFDTRTGAQSDGNWTLFIDNRRMERTQWRKASVANMRGPVCVVDHVGTERLIPEGSESDLSELIGQMLKAVLLRARDEGLLLRLPQASTCRLAVEDFDGNFGWPINEAASDI